MDKHTKVSLIKSFLRIIASFMLIGVGIGLPFYPLGIFDTAIYGGILLLVAEILGIVEEIN